MPTAGACLLLRPAHLQDAVSDAYDRTLAQIHAWVVRAGIKTGMMALPTREHFLASIGETGARAGLPASWVVGWMC